MGDIDWTLGAMAEQGWTVVLLEPGTKRLRDGHTWEECQTKSVGTVRNWLHRGGGIGLDVYASGIVVLDLDADRALERLCARTTILPPTATSPSGGTHVYLAAPAAQASPASRAPGAPAGPAPNPGPPDVPPARLVLPALLTLDGERIGEVIRGPRQQVVMPPTRYPGNVKRNIPAGGHYRWLMDPTLPPYCMPREVLDLLLGGDVPSYIDMDGAGVLPQEPWDGPSAEEILRAARSMPAAKRRARGIKFQCPACRRDGHDKHRDNAFVALDGRWGCAYAPGDSDHKRAIGVALGVLSDDPVSMSQLTRDFLSEE